MLLLYRINWAVLGVHRYSVIFIHSGFQTHDTFLQDICQTRLKSLIVFHSLFERFQNISDNISELQYNFIVAFTVIHK